MRQWDERDLRAVFPLQASYAPDDVDDDLDADDEDDAGPSPAADDAAVVPGTDDVAGEGDEEIRHPERKAASEEAKRYRLRLKEERKLREAAEARIHELENDNALNELRQENADLRLRLAFNDTCHLYRVDDRDAVWRLAGDDLKNVADEDGISTERLDSVVRSVVSRYPHFTEDDAPDDEPLPTEASGRMTNARKQSGAAGDLEVLRKKFPALRR